MVAGCLAEFVRGRGGRALESGKPRLLSRLAGVFLLRLATRALVAVLFQGPRSTLGLSSGEPGPGFARPLRRSCRPPRLTRLEPPTVGRAALGMASCSRRRALFHTARPGRQAAAPAGHEGRRARIRSGDTMPCQGAAPGAAASFREGYGRPSLRGAWPALRAPHAELYTAPRREFCLGRGFEGSRIKGSAVYLAKRKPRWLSRLEGGALPRLATRTWVAELIQEPPR